MRAGAVLLVVVAGLGPVAAQAASGPGAAGGLLARLPFGARVLALGGPQGALPDSPGSMLANPAAMGAVGKGAVEAGYDQGISDVRYSGLAAAGEVLPWLSAGFAARLLTAGTIETYDYVGTRYSADLEQDHLVAAGAAARLGGLCAGASLKYVGSTLLGAWKSSSILVDLGIRLHLPLGAPEWYDAGIATSPNPNWIALSLAASNMGQRFEYGGASDEAPAAWSAGAVVGQTLGRRARILLSFAADVPRETARPAGRAGVEGSWPISVVEAAIRAGTRMNRDGGTFSGGFGVSMRGISLDYAYLGKTGPFDSTHHVTLGFNLGSYRRAAPDPTR